jgi:hypothetical protein
MTRPVLVLAAISLLMCAVLLWAASWLRSYHAEIPIKVVATEGIRAQRQDAETFALRWAGIALLPPATEVRYVSESVVVGTVPGLKPHGPSGQPRHRLRSRLARLDVCARHNMRKVKVGKYRWRCRR